MPAAMASPMSHGSLIGPFCAPNVVLPANAITERDGITFFAVEVTPARGSAPWSVQRRYTDFVELRTGLGLAEDSLPGSRFPPKLLMFRWLGDRLEARRAGLEAWLLAVLRAPSAHCAPAVCRFLTGVDRAGQEALLRAATSLFDPA